MSDCAVAAIEFAIELGTGDDGLEFLHYWNVGEFDTIRRNWNAPESVFIGADPLHPQTKNVFPIDIPQSIPMEPFQTIDKSNKNYKAGWNACRSEFIRLLENGVVDE